MIAEIVHERGPLTVAAFMDLALYHPQLGYYARAAQRSGRAGDFFTSVDVGPLFGELVEVQIAEMFQILRATAPTGSTASSFDLVEAGAGNGRLAADILRAARDRDPELYAAVQLHLVEAGGAAREAQRATLGELAERLQTSAASLPDRFEGTLVANELLDAMPVHQVVMRDDGLREVYVVVDASGNLQTIEGPPSTPALQAHLARAEVTLGPGWRVEIGLAAVEWVRNVAQRLTRGFVVLIDYGHPARELYSVSHASGTLTTFSGHQSRGPEAADRQPPWLQRPGEQDITAHVDFTSVRAAAEAEGLVSLGFLDQTYFLLGLLPSIRNPQSSIRHLKSLVMPGGLGSTLKVLLLGKGVGAPALAGCSFKVRAT